MTKIDNSVIYLISYPGVDKFTIANAIKDKLDNARVIDNHSINNLIFPFVRIDGKTKLPDEIWDYTDKIRDIVSDVLKNLSSRKFVYIFTNAFCNEVSGEYDEYKKVEDATNIRGLNLFPIRLIIDKEEHRKRITSDNRELMQKMTTDCEVNIWHQEKTILNTKHKNELTINITNKKPDQVADLIIEYIGK